LGSLGSFLLLWAAQGFWQMLLASLLLAASWTTILPLVETVAVSGIRRGALDYGKVRLWGSLSFIVASLGSGLVIGRFGSQTALPLLVGGAALMVVGAHLVPHTLAGASHVPPPLRRLSLSAIHFLTHAVSGLVLGTGTIASGPLYRIFTGEAYVAMALLALLGAGSAFLLMRRWHGGLVVAGHHPHSSDVGGAIIPPS
jgi:hypothetical protein